MSLIIQSALPDPSISHFVHSFWMLENNTGKDISSTVLPNGMVDLAVMSTDPDIWQKTIRGLDTVPSEILIPKGTKMFSVGFKLLAVEYLFGDSVKDFLNTGKVLSDEIWYFDKEDLSTFEKFQIKTTAIIKNIAAENIDNRKKKLFELIYSSEGSVTVKLLSESVFWSSRQINRYFNQQFGISLKVYCNILRFGSSFKHISEGRLFPEQNFTDQNHFIKEIKKYSGVTPKELSKNKNNRFMDIAAIKKLNQEND